MTMQELPKDIKSQIAAQSTALLEKGQKLGRFDKIRERWLYSSQLFAPGLGGTISAGKYEIFTAIKGDIGQGYQGPITDRETNWVAKRRVPDQQNLLVHGYAVEIRRPPTDYTATGLNLYPPSTLTAGALANPPAAGKVDPRVPLHPTDLAQVAHGMLLAYTYLTNTVPLGKLADFPSPGGAVGFNEASRQFPSNATAGLSSTPQGADNRAYLPLARNSCMPRFERTLMVPQLLQHGETFAMVLIVPNPITLLSVPPSLGPTGEQNDATGAVEIVVGLYCTESYVERS